MASFNLEERSDSQPFESNGGPDSHSSGNCSQGLGLLVWLGQLARDESTRRPAKPGTADVLDALRVLGRFQLEALLGTGAYGAVFRALDTHLGRHVALKLAWPGVLMDPVASRRFVDEPKTVALLKHRGIVEVYDSGEIEMACFIALELIDGPTLAQWFKGQEHVGVRLAAQIVRSVAEAIHFAHERGIIHRDLKPSNILLRPTGRDSEFPYEPVVTDFGLARRPLVSEMSALTGTQAIVGTDHYMSPEQAAGRKGEVGPASDIFSLGVILYELVAGRRPFDGDSCEQIRQRIQEDEAPAIRPWRKSVPKDLETIAFKCLEKSPSRRYASARDLADDLGRFLDHKPISARPIRVWQRGWKFARRRPLVVSLVSLAMVSLLVVTALLGAWAADRASAARQIAAAEAASTVTEGIERQHQYVSNIQQAAEALRRVGRREVIELLEQCRSLAREPVHLGLEWNWLWSKTHDADVTLNAHSTGVRTIRFSPRGELLVSGGKDARIVFWDTVSWTKRHELRFAADDEISVVDFSADGSLLAAGSEDGRIVVYRVQDRIPIFDEPVVKGRVHDLTWLGDSKQIAVGGEDAVLSVIDPVSRECRRKPLTVSPQRRAIDPGHPTVISSLAYIPSHRALAVVVYPATNFLIDPVSLETLTPSLGEDRSHHSAYYIPIEQGYIATAGQGVVRLWKTGDGSLATELTAQSEIESLRYSDAARLIAVACRGGTVETCGIDDILLRRNTGGRQFCAHTGRAVTVDVSPDGTWLASGGWDGDIKLWNRASMREPFDTPLSGRPIRIEFSPCGRWLALTEQPAQEPPRLTVFDVGTGGLLWSTHCLSEEVGLYPHGMAFGPSGDEIANVEPDFSISRREARTGKLKSSIDVPEHESLTGIRYSPDGKSLLIRRPHKDILVVDCASGAIVDRVSDRCLGMFRTVHGDVWLEAEPSRELVLRGGPRSPPMLTLRGLAETPLTPVTSSDGRYIAVPGGDRVVYFWDLARGGLPGKCVGHESVIRAVGFSPDSRTIISQSDDGTVRFWNIATRAELLKLGTAQNPIMCMGLNPKGDLLVLGAHCHGRWGLQIHRLGPDRDSLPKQFDPPPSSER